MIVKHLRRFFGSIAVNKGFITKEQLISALEVQKMEDMEKKPHRPIVLILYDMGFMRIKQINEVHKSLVTPLYEL